LGAVLTTCTVYRIEVDGNMPEMSIRGQGRGTKSIVDLSILPEYQGKGIGKAVLEQSRRWYKTYSRHPKGNAQFFLEIRVRSKEEDGNYYDPGWMDILLPSRTQGELGSGEIGVSIFNKIVF